MKSALSAVFLSVMLATLLSACGTSESPPEPLRSVRTAEVAYDQMAQANRYFGSVQSRHEVDQGFRVGGKITERRVDVGQKVREGDVLAVLDEVDYRLAEEAAQRQLAAATTQAHQAESDRRRLEDLKIDGSVSAAEEEHAQSRAQQTKAAAEAEERKVELARNRLRYTVLRASRTGVVTNVRAEVGQVVAEGQPVVSVAGEGEPEIVVDVPEDHLAEFKTGRFKASLASEPDDRFPVTLRELAPQAAAQTRTYRARLKPSTPRRLPLGATATLLVERPVAAVAAAPIPASAITQTKGQPAVWVVRRVGTDAVGTVELSRVAVHAYRNDVVLVSGLPAGELVVTAGVQKMAPGLRVLLPRINPAGRDKEASR